MKESLEVTRKQKRLGLEETPHNVEVSMLPLFNADTNAKPEIHMDVYRRAIRQRLWMWGVWRRRVGLGEKERIRGKRQQKDEFPLPANPVAPPTSTEDLEEARRLAPSLAALKKGLIVEPVKDTRLAVRETRLIDIRFSQPKPQTAAKVP